MWWHKKKEVAATLEEQLIEAQATLARYEQLPEEDFTYKHPQLGMILKHGVDEKPNEIARLKGDIAELKVRIEAQREKGEGV